ncbi:MAG: ATP-binding protein, partial [Pseudomonadota bacterium]
FCTHLVDIGVLDDPDRRARIELAAHEATSIAVLHGNLGLADDWRVNPAAFRRRAAAVRDALSDPERAARRVGLAAAWTADALELAVADQGPGYSPKAIDEAKNRPGRGLGIVTAHADAVSFEDDGRVIRLTFER